MIDLSKKDFAVVKARILKNLNTFDTLQRKNLDSKFKEAMCAKEIGEEALARELLKKANARFPNDAELQNATKVLLSEPKSNPPPVVIYRRNPA